MVPPGIGKVTAEAEVGLVIGRTCYQVGVEDAMSYVAGNRAGAGSRPPRRCCWRIRVTSPG